MPAAGLARSRKLLVSAVFGGPASLYTPTPPGAKTGGAGGPPTAATQHNWGFSGPKSNAVPLTQPVMNTWSTVTGAASRLVIRTLPPSGRSPECGNSNRYAVSTDKIGLGIAGAAHANKTRTPSEWITVLLL